MLSRLPTARTAADACPGALRPHHAADGELVRVRVPGGAVTAAALRAVAGLAARFGDGRVGLTSRANLQLRALATADLAAVAAGLHAAGLLPSVEHDRVRNILGPALSGRLPGSHGDVDGLVAELDAALLARPWLAELPGRFLFAMDDGAGCVPVGSADVALVAAAGGGVVVGVAGRRVGEVEAGQAAAAALSVAEAFLAERAATGSPAWRVAELGPDAVLSRLGWTASGSLPSGTEPPVGLVDQSDGRHAVPAIAPLGLLSADAAEAVAAAAELGDGQVRVTPSRRVVLRDLELPAALAARELLATNGLVTEPGTGWDRLTACAGRPGCAKSLTDVHADAVALAPTLAPVGPRLHLAGCDRGCGAPAGAGLRIATGAGYRQVSR